MDFIILFLLLIALIFRSEYLLISIGILATIPIVISAFKSLQKHKISVDLLATFALTVSLINHEWISAAFINLMITSARIFGTYTENKARQSIASLLKLRPKFVKLKKGKLIVQIPIDEVKIGQTIVINSGDRIPIDGTVISGQASVDQSSLTGESLPILKSIHSPVFSSTLNLSGTIYVKAEKIGADTTFGKIIKLMESAQQQKGGVKSLVDNFTAYYILATAFVALLVYLVTANINFVLSILLVTCADDIAVAVPLAYIAAIAKAASQGIIIKGGTVLEDLAHSKTIIVDKTGTLTQGKIKVLHLFTFHGFDQTKIINLSGSISQLSSHPLSQAVTNFATSHHFTPIIFSKIKEVPGQGIIASDKDNNRYLFGNLELLSRHHIHIKTNQSHALNRLKQEGHNLILISKNKLIIGILGLGDNLKLGIKNNLREILTNKINRIIMLTGDNSSVAKDIAKAVGNIEFFANMLPQDKVNFIKNYQEELGQKVIFVGDGINDSAAIAQSNVGIAMGTIGSDATIEAADITIMDDNFYKINTALKLSQHVSKIVFQDFIIWAVVNFIGLFLVFAFHISPQSAAAYNFFSDFIPLLNSFRILRLYL